MLMSGHGPDRLCLRDTRPLDRIGREGPREARRIFGRLTTEPSADEKALAARREIRRFRWTARLVGAVWLLAGLILPLAAPGFFLGSGLRIGLTTVVFVAGLIILPRLLDGWRQRLVATLRAKPAAASKT
jgi:hypothetical protein